MKLSRLLRALTPQTRRRPTSMSLDAEGDFRADISFVIADLKYRPGNLKLLEFGQGQLSSFLGYYRLYGRDLVWGAFWEFLRECELPVGLMTTEVPHRKPKDLIRSAGKCGVPEFTAIRGAAEFDAFVRSCRERRAAEPGSSNFSRIRGHSGIVMKAFEQRHLAQLVRGGDPVAAAARIDEYRQRLRSIASECSDFLLLNGATALYSWRKDELAKLFDQDSLRCLVPQDHTYSTSFRADLAAEICSEIDAPALVIKPLNSSRGRGVLIRSRAEFASTLKAILTKDPELSSGNESLSYWLTDTNDRFIVQSYEPSRTIVVEGRPYDATMRQFFLLRHDAGKIELCFAGGFWKLPGWSLDDDAPFQERVKSLQNHTRFKSAAVMSAKIGRDDSDAVQEILGVALPVLYRQMLARHSPETG